MNLKLSLLLGVGLAAFFLGGCAKEEPVETGPPKGAKAAEANATNAGGAPAQTQDAGKPAAPPAGAPP